jgi:hypothetical protein
VILLYVIRRAAAFCLLDVSAYVLYMTSIDVWCDRVGFTSGVRGIFVKIINDVGTGSTIFSITKRTARGGVVESLDL